MECRLHCTALVVLYNRVVNNSRLNWGNRVGPGVTLNFFDYLYVAL
jgi:hypothetical protein